MRSRLSDYWHGGAFNSESTQVGSSTEEYSNPCVESQEGIALQQDGFIRSHPLSRRMQAPPFARHCSCSIEPQPRLPPSIKYATHINRERTPRFVHREECLARIALDDIGVPQETDSNAEFGFLDRSACHR